MQRVIGIGETVLDILLPRITADDIVLFGSFFAINPVIRPVTRKLLTEAREAGAWLYYDVNFRKNHIAELPTILPNIEENMRLASVVRGSMEDFDYLFGLRDADAIYDRVRTLCSTLILTDGARSICVYESDNVTTYDVQKIDTDHHVILFLDSRLKDAPSLSFHPNDCRGTVVISQAAFQQYLASVGNKVEYIKTT